VVTAFIVTAIALLLYGCGGGGLPEDAAVSVNGDIITKDDVAARIDYRGKISPGMVSSEDPVNFPKIRRQTTKDLVLTRLEQQEAEKRGITVSGEDVTDGLQTMADDEFLGDAPRMMQYYADSGVTEQELRLTTYERLVHEKLTAAVRETVTVSEYDIQQYYQKNIKQFNQSEVRQARMIETTSEAVLAEASRRIAAGESFIDVAKQVSVDPLAAKNGGDLGLVARGQLSPELDSVLFSLAVGEISSLVPVADRWYLLRVEAIQPGREKSLDEAREEIRQSIAIEQSAGEWQTLMDGLYASASLEYDPDYDPSA
jgi:parvulin-like peptidyl-prolyl isomerase